LGLTLSDSFPYRYTVYGIGLHSEIQLPLPTHGPDELSHISLWTEPASYFSEAIRGIALEQADGSWYQIGRLSDGSCYARWNTVGEFWVSADGRQIRCRRFDEVHKESFDVYLLGQALSFALVKSGFEPIHATVIAVHGEAVVFLGDSGYGKSTLAASFINAGYPVLTDDLLMLKVTHDGAIAYPGPARIKLFPNNAARFLGNMAMGVRMNPDTEKLIIPLDASQSCSIPLPVRMIYSLAPPYDVFRKQHIHIEPLTPREACIELVKNTFNYRIVDGERLMRQLHATAHLASRLPVRRLSIPRDLNQLPSVRQVILSGVSDVNVAEDERAMSEVHR
jgi:hypothetical protein